jgi:nitrile hydratase
MEHGSAHDHEDLVGQVPSDPALRIKALESVLVEVGLVDPAAIDAWIEAYEAHTTRREGRGAGLGRSGYGSGTRRSAGAIAEMDLLGMQGQHMAVVETPKVRHIVVCTLCSCYPWPVLGLPPVWYKSAPYRARAVIDPRGVLKELGSEVAEGVEVRVWDSTAELRYLVLPGRPAGTEGWSEDELAAIVTRDAMIGVAPVIVPEPSGR